MTSCESETANFRTDIEFPVGKWEVERVGSLLFNYAEPISASEMKGENGKDLSDMVYVFDADGTYYIYFKSNPEEICHVGKWWEEDGEIYHENPIAEKMSSGAVKDIHHILKLRESIMINNIMLKLFLKRIE